MTKIHYVYDPDTYEYLHEYAAEESPREPGEYIKPTHSLPFDEINMIPAVEGKARVISADLKALSYVDDYRGQVICNPTTRELQIAEKLGPLPDGWQLGELPKTTDELAISARAMRDILMGKVQNKIDRYYRYERTGATQIDDISSLDVQMQKLADVPAQAGFPSDIDWPDI